jgi:hypothetical protein
VITPTLILPHQGGGEFFRELDAPQLCCGVLHFRVRNKREGFQVHSVIRGWDWPPLKEVSVSRSYPQQVSCSEGCQSWQDTQGWEFRVFLLTSFVFSKVLTTQNTEEGLYYRQNSATGEYHKAMKGSISPESVERSQRVT